MKQLVIIGAGGFGREVFAWASSAGNEWRIRGYLDDSNAAGENKSLKAPVIGTVGEYTPQTDDVFICAIGVPKLRRSTSEHIMRKGGRFVTLVHPTALVAESAHLEPGVIVCPFALVSVDAKVGQGTAVYYHSTIDHDARLGAWCQISAHCDVTGGVTLGDEVFLGSHSSILPGIHVGDRSIIGAGAIVTGDVPPDSTMVGIPAADRRKS